MNRIIMIALLWLACGFNAQAANTVYQWVDENGSVHFSDRPQEGARELEVKVTPPVTKGPIATPQASAPQKAKPVDYHVEVLSPSHEQTIRSNEGAFSVSSTATPVPVDSLGYKIVLDGIPQGSIQNSGQFDLTNIERGAHTIVVQLVERSGKEIASSKPITVFLHRASAIKNNTSGG